MRIESEKLLDQKLSVSIKRLGGWSIKLIASHITGLPDRLCLLPGGNMFFAEIKTTGKKPSKIQVLVHEKIKALGFKVYIIDNSDLINKILAV